MAAGMVPARPNWDGLMPVPGDGRYEWKGFLTPDQLPSEADPRQGWFASANQMNLPADYPVAERKVGFEWSNPARFLRVDEVLAAKPKLTVADAMALQTDPYDITSRRLIAVLAPLKTDDPKLTRALALLRGWDHRTSEGSAGAALFEVWTGKHLGRAVVAATTPKDVQGVIGNGDLAAVMELLENPDATLPAEAATRC
uniref:Penicillin acylase family protein n=1 Tax=Phenylobacterium glaciei TaxID=2803784 RepID=A0A974P6S9_9CAUL|nr:penicillin acylase family protein [Phenylobacterium glaciei]